MPPKTRSTGKGEPDEQGNSVTDDLPMPEQIPLMENDANTQPQDRIDKMLSQMNNLTTTMNAMVQQFSAVKSELTQVTTVLLQVQSNKEDITKLDKRVTEVEGSLTFNDVDREGIKHQIKIIEMEQKAQAARLNKIEENSKQQTTEGGCKCADRLEQLENEMKKRNIIISGAIEKRNEHTKYLALEILSNINVQIAPDALEQAVRVGQYKQKAPTRPILVKFKSQALRDEVLYHRQQVKNNPKCKNIWLNEDLTDHAKSVRADMRALGNLAADLGHKVVLKGNAILIDDTRYNEHSLSKLPPHLSLERAYTRDTPNGLAFHSKHSPYSNFAYAPIVYKDNRYICNEQAFQHTKATVHNETIIAQKIMKTDDPIIMKRLGDKITASDEWNNSQNDFMEVLVDIKFDQNPKLGKKLVETKQKPLLEATLSSHWGIGMPLTHPDLKKKSFVSKGKNFLGKLLENKREDMRLRYGPRTPPLPTTTTPTVPTQPTLPATLPKAANQHTPPLQPYLQLNTTTALTNRPANQTKKPETPPKPAKLQ